MWDEKHDAEFLAGENADHYEPYWWNDGEPLWITAKKQVMAQRTHFLMVEVFYELHPL